MGNLNSSFGVEIEFVIGTQVGRGERAKPRMLQNSPGKPIAYDMSEIDWLRNTPVSLVQEAIRACIEEALVGHTGDRVITSQMELLNDVYSRHLSRYGLQWNIDQDVSVAMDGDLIERDKNFKNYEFINIEITSPALIATDRSYDEIRHVLIALHQRFWILAPPSAGLHVHYGRGKDWIPFPDLRKIAALLYAADPILAQMHPARRRNESSQWCLSNRLYSNLAHGVPIKEALANIAGSLLNIADEAEPEEVAKDLPSVMKYQEEKNKRDSQTGNNFKSIFERGTIESYTFSRDDFNAAYWYFMHGKETIPGFEKGKPLDVIPAARELLSAPTAPVVAILMDHSHNDRLAYNFHAYLNSYYRRPNSLNQSKRTIEFRQAAGTVDAEEIIAYAKIAVRICECASMATTDDLWKMIGDLVVGEKDSNWYDIFDFLVDLKLEPEARVIERRMARERGIEILDQERGLAKHPITKSKSSSVLSILGKILPGSQEGSPGRSRSSGVSEGSHRGRSGRHYT